MNFSKSKYCLFCQCPKILWLDKYKKHEFVADEATTERLNTGNEVGDLAMRLFGDFCEVTAFDEQGNLDISKMIKNTADCIKNGVENICEASFFADGLYCAVDILRKQDGGYAIYEVKSSTRVHSVYVTDVFYQKCVLQKCGINVVGTYIVHINGNYERMGSLELSKLFCIEDISELVEQESRKRNIESDLATANAICSYENEPAIDLSESCRSPYECGYWKYCSRRLPSPSIFDLYRLGFDKKIQAYRKGYTRLSDAAQIIRLSAIQKRQIEYAYEQKPAHVDVVGIRTFLSSLSYPLCFLDFETMQPVVPEFSHSTPYQQIPFQYSLHLTESENGEILHKEFLGESGTDPRRELALQLVRDVPKNACVLAYNKSFECSRLAELAVLFPDLAPTLLAIRDNVKDLMEPFCKGYYYAGAMGNSFSIKSVLPAMFPSDPSLDYHYLEGVHNGTEAMALFPKIKDLPHTEQEKAKQRLLKYCELDTLAMVKIWQKLVELSK